MSLPNATMSVDKTDPERACMCKTCQHQEAPGNAYPCNCCWNPLGDMYRVKLVEPPVVARPKPTQPPPGEIRLLFNLIGEYFDLGVAEGREGRDHDTADSAAQRKWIEIQTVVFRLSANQKPPDA